LKDPSQALSALFRLTDREIVGLARGRPLRPKEELRWRLLKAAYFRETVDDEVIDGTDDAD
jgi:hypothetical protein